MTISLPYVYLPIRDIEVYLKALSATNNKTRGPEGPEALTKSPQ